MARSSGISVKTVLCSRSRQAGRGCRRRLSRQGTRQEQEESAIGKANRVQAVQPSAWLAKATVDLPSYSLRA